MARAVQLASRGLFTTHPNPRVGCVIANSSGILGEGWHRVPGGPHAEIVAIQDAATIPEDATLYVTLEPCCHSGKTPACTNALLDAGIKRVVAAMLDPNPLVSGRGISVLRNAGVAVEVGLLSEQAEKLNPGFISRMTRKRPFVRCKMAMSIDGRTAMASGESKWITGDAARLDVQRLRAASAAIMTGIGTVESDNPSLNVRWDALEHIDNSLDGIKSKQPLRVVVDSALQIRNDAKLLNINGNTLMACASGYADDDRFHDNVDVVALDNGSGRVDLSALMRSLGEMEINEVLLESGATLAGAMLREKLVDELVIYMSARVMGDGARGLFHLSGLDKMADCLKLDIKDIRPVGEDWRIHAGIIYSD